MLTRTMQRPGFTLIELLIVIVILAILAAIVIPQFGQATEDARLSVLQNTLATVRSQIAMYALQHSDTDPTDAGFVDQMIGQTDISGDTTGTDFGPYVQDIPINPFSNTNVVSTNAVGATEGWYYSAGEFRANHSTDYTGY